MEKRGSPRAETKLNPSFLPSPNSHSSSNSSTSSNAPITTTTTRSELNINNNNPYPTTFVQADTTSFKQVVQMLTGSTETIHKQTPNRNPIPPVKSPARNKTGFKLFERRNSMKNGLKISPLSSGLLGNNQSSNLYNFSPRKSEILSPSMLDFPSLVLSPVTPLMLTDPIYRMGCSKTQTGSSGLSLGLEEKAIAEKGFYLHSSPRQSSDEKPKLLPLFPVTSPKCSGSSSSSS